MDSNDGHLRAWDGGDSDEELQLALRISAEVALQRQAATTGEAGGATPADGMLRQALAMIMAQPQANTQSTSPAASNVPAGATNEDDQVSDDDVFQQALGMLIAPNAAADGEARWTQSPTSSMAPGGSTEGKERAVVATATQSPTSIYKEDADYFELIPGTETRRTGQNKANYLCCCCPISRFGKQLGWKNPITFRVSDVELHRGFEDHVRSKNGRHRCWETVEKVHKMITSGNGRPSQQDLENLATTGDILKKYKIYEENWTNTVSVEEKEGVKKKFDEARLVYVFLEENFKKEIEQQLAIRKSEKAAERKKRSTDGSGPGGGSGRSGAGGGEAADESGVGESGGGDSSVSLVQKTLESLPPEKRRRLDEELRELLSKAIQEEKKETVGSAKGGNSSRGARGSSSGGKSCVVEGDAGGQTEENRVLKEEHLLEACKEDLYAWPIAAQHLAEVAQLSMPYCLLRACVALK
jgi:uncharacterized membrane protein YgcG